MKRLAQNGRWSIAGAALAALLTGGCADDPPDVEACALEPDPGTCEADIPKYYYDGWTGECAEFSWGGCGGVAPFDSMAACEKACE